MRQGPVQAHDVAPMPPRVARDMAAVTLHELLCIPSRRKDRPMHGATARRVAVPPLPPVDALPRLVRPEDEAGDISRAGLKAFLTTTEVSKTCRAFGDGLWYPGDRQHVILRHVYALIARLAACGVGVRRRGIWTTAERPPTATPWPPFRSWALTSISPNLTALSSSIPLVLATTFQVVSRDKPPSR
jgi:hypothetical protein